MSNDRYSEVTLESVRFACQHHLSARGFYGAPLTTVSTMLDHMTNDMIVMMEREIWAEPKVTHTVRHPLDWWEHVKQRWFPAWALKRWPVAETVHELHIQRLYPEYIWKQERMHMRTTIAIREERPLRESDDYDTEYYS